MSRLAVFALLIACSHGAPPRLGASDVVLAIADDWSSTKVSITHWRFQGSSWERIGDSWAGVVGDAGLAWGDGLHGRGAPTGDHGPVKHEGDHRSPAGAFRITTRFGFDPTEKTRVLTDQTECVDDPRSTAYNQIVERTASADWTSSEHMRSVPQYALGAVVDHNPSRKPGAGSCIFLHIWDGPDSTTVGCTAMDRDKLDELLRSLGPEPVFVLLPRSEYEALRKPWGLPAQ